MIGILFRHFHLLIALNLLLSFLLLIPIFRTDHFSPALVIGLVVKLVSYGAAMAFEFWLYAPKRECYLKNMGFGYPELFRSLFLCDIVLFFSIVFLWKTLMVSM